MLNQKKALALLEKYNFSYPSTTFFTEQRIPKIKYPTILKVDSSDAVHKSDLGLVFTDINNAKDVKDAVKQIKKVVEKEGIEDYKMFFQEKIDGTELIFGMKRDAVFGPVIVFGLGGIFVEIVKDVAMRIAPLTRKDCLEMIDSIKGKKLLEGYRNSKKVHIPFIIDVMLNLSRLSMNENHINEIDFNPVIVNEEKAYVVDARFLESENA